MPRRATAKQKKDVKDIEEILKYIAEKPRTKEELQKKFAKKKR
jgi:hypothetical protein